MSESLPTLDEQSSFYDERWDRESHRPLNGIRLKRAAAILNEIGLLAVENPRILDFGCGTGTFTGMLNQVGNAVGVELSPHAVELAKKRMPNIDFRSGDVFEIDLQEASFDLLVLQEVIEHVEDQSDLIRRCCSLIKPSGHLIMTTPNKSITHQSGTYEKAKKKGTLQPIENLLTVAEAKKLVSECFTVVRCETIIPVGHRGILRVLNSPKLTQFQFWRAFQSCLSIGLHTVVVGRRT